MAQVDVSIPTPVKNFKLCDFVFDNIEISHNMALFWLYMTKAQISWTGYDDI